ncbi:hypothetical protein Zm00014a_012876 [Zea mays]|uniref:Uncharacterized protein n=1 Tax=Zea mays TaxID=4577 RepID=A0A3L6EDB9_MAIZE|nr:hypothetical protein Zm00014a_012876 [Zea mays]
MVGGRLSSTTILSPYGVSKHMVLSVYWITALVLCNQFFPRITSFPIDSITRRSAGKSILLILTLTFGHM